MRRLITGEATPEHGRSWLPRIAADEYSGAAAAPGATALAMVLPQELHHFS